MPPDIARYLARKQFPGETLGDALRRLLDLPGGPIHRQLLATLARGTNLTERFLFALRFLYSEDPERF